MEASEDVSKDLPLEVQQLLSDNTHLKHCPEKNKIHCSLTGHEMSCEVKVISTYLNGKKCRRLKALNDNVNFSKYKQHIVDSTKKFHKHQLFCLLTLKHINKHSKHIEKHVNGRKFKNALKRWEECQKSGKKFVPISRKPRQHVDSDDLDDSLKNSMDNEDEENDSDDSLSDLYPNEMLCDENGNED